MVSLGRGLSAALLLAWVGIGSPVVPAEAFVGAPGAVGRPGLLLQVRGAGVCPPSRAELGARRGARGAGVWMQGGGLSLPDLFGRMRLAEGGLGEQRQELNRLHMERDALLLRVKMKMRAASYNFGAQDWRKLFARYDRDRSGAIDFGEFEALCRSVGLQPTQMSVEELWIVFEEVDPERRGSIEVGDFTAWLSGRAPDYSAAPQAPAAPPPPAQHAPQPVGRAGDSELLVDDAWAWSYGAVTGLNMPVPPEISPAPALRAEEEPAGGAVSANSRPAAAAGRVDRGAVRGSQAVGNMEELMREVLPFVDGGAPAERVREVVYLLVNELGLSRGKVMGLAIAAPSVFAMDLAAELRPQVDYLLEIGVPSTRVGKMLSSFPQILELSQDKKEATVRYLEQLGMPLHSIGKCLSQQPQLLGLSVETKLQPTVQFLVSECRVPKDKIGNLISTFPTVLAYSIEATLVPRLAFIREELNVPRHKLAPLLLKFPQLLGLAIEANVQPTIGYLTNEIGIPRSEISKIVQQHPHILGLSVEANLKPKVSFLLNEIGVPRDRLARIVASFPTLLSLSIDTNLRPKMEYLINEAGFPREDILKAPHLLAYSLKQRIQPRIEFVRSNNIPMALHSILSLSNQAFVKRFDDFADFKPSAQT